MDLGIAGKRALVLASSRGLGLAAARALARGADGVMTGFAYPEMLVSVCALFAAGRSGEAEDLFDVYLPLVRHEQQPGFGLAVRKEILRRRGAIRSAAVRSPGPKLDTHDVGSDECRIALLTADPLRAFDDAKAVLERKGLLEASVALYRPVDGQNYTVLWPRESDLDAFSE